MIKTPKIKPYSSLLDLKEKRNWAYESSNEAFRSVEKMKLAGKSEDDIKESFVSKTAMKIFSWNGEIDTVMPN